MRQWIKKHRVVTVVILVVVMAGSGAAFFFKKKIPGKDIASRAARQNTTALEKMNLSSSISATGTIESANTKTLQADVNEVEVKSVKVEEGETVKKGQTLVTFDKVDLETAWEEAKENLSDIQTQCSNELSQAKRKLSEAQETYNTQKKKLAASVALAKSEYETAKKAVFSAKTTVEKQKAEETKTQKKTAYEQAKSEQESTNKQNKSAIQTAKDSVTTTKSNQKKTLREAEKSVEEAKSTLEACSVTAPMDGTVTAIGVEAGDIYSGGDLIEISDCTDLQVSTTVSEQDIAKVKKGLKAVVLTDATDDTELEGTISYVAMTTGNSLESGSSSGSNSMSTGNSNTSNSSGYEVRIKLKDNNENIRVGMTAKCSIVLEEAADVYAVPYDAVHTNSDGKSVIYVMDSASSSRKEIVVTKGMESDYYVEISSDELSEGILVLLPSDTTSSGSTSEEKSESDNRMSGKNGKGDFPNMGGGFGGGGAPAGGPPSM